MCVIFPFFSICVFPLQTTWANGADALGKFLYTSYNETDFQLFASLYDYHNVSAGFNKVNVTLNARPQSRTWPSMLNTLYASKLTISPRDVSFQFGMVAQYCLECNISDNHNTLGTY